MQLVCFKFVFEICMKIETPRGSVNENYTLYLLAGYLPWLLFRETVQRSANSLVENANLITKTVFPAEIVPMSIFLSSLLNHLMTLTIVVVGAAWWLHRVGPQLLLLPVFMLLTGMLAIGLSWIVAGLQVYLRDTAQAVIVLLDLWFWLTPIFIYEEYYPRPFQFLLEYNPLAYLVRAYRDLLLSTNLPSPDQTAVIALYAVAFFAIGGLLFRQLKRGFADVL